MVIAGIRAVLLDIEGTVAPISFVHHVLFPYARAQLGLYLRTNWDDAEVRAARAQIVADAKNENEIVRENSIDEIEAEVLRRMDADAKATGLKLLQGLIWREGYQSGRLQSQIFADVPPALRDWKAAGKIIAIYSSGSVAAQKVFFGHSDAGDLTPFLSNFFDTTTGPKRSVASYQAISRELKQPPGQILFLSDVLEEVEAARSAGFVSRIVIRPGNAPLSVDPELCINSFADVSLT